MNQPLRRHAVTLADGERAIAALRARGRVDIDRYLAEIDATRLLASRVGPTEECLVVDSLDQYIDVPGLLSLPPHVSQCTYCTEALRVYATVRSRAMGEQWDRSHLKLWVEPIDMIYVRETPTEFNITLQANQSINLLPCNVKMASATGIMGKIDCQEVHVLESHELAGSTYRALCVVEPAAGVLNGKVRTDRVLDHLRISGHTSTGQSFATGGLVEVSLESLRSTSSSAG